MFTVRDDFLAFRQALDGLRLLHLGPAAPCSAYAMQSLLRGAVSPGDIIPVDAQLSGA